MAYTLTFTHPDYESVVSSFTPTNTSVTMTPPEPDHTTVIITDCTTQEPVANANLGPIYSAETPYKTDEGGVFTFESCNDILACAGQSNITISPISSTATTIPASGGSFTFNIPTYYGIKDSITFTSAVGFSSVVPSSISARMYRPSGYTSTVTVNIASNSGGSRTFHLTAQSYNYARQSVSSNTITFSQAAGGLWDVSPTSMDFPSSGGTQTLYITDSMQVGWNIGGSLVTWATILPRSGSSSTEVQVVVDENSRFRERSATITVTNGLGGSQDVVLNQSGMTPLREINFETNDATVYGAVFGQNECRLENVFISTASTVHDILDDNIYFCSADGAYFEYGSSVYHYMSYGDCDDYTMFTPIDWQGQTITFYILLEGDRDGVPVYAMSSVSAYIEERDLTTVSLPNKDANWQIVS